MPGFSRYVTQTATTKRTPAIVSGKRGAPAAYLSNVPCTPSYPVSPETMRRMNLNTPAQIRMCHVFALGSYDIVEGDSMTISGETPEYLVYRLERWNLPGGREHSAIYLQDLKG